jgi:putative ABC transport system substrate-binding protein
VKRRDAILTFLALGAAGAPLTVAAQSPRRIGFLYFGSRQSAMSTGRYGAFLEGMKALGYSQGKDFVIEERFSDGKEDLTIKYATELARSKVDLILAAGSPAVHAARRATKSVPIVVAVMGGDPVASGLAASLARPGGNITGLYVSNVELVAKQIELLGAVLPKLSRLSLLVNPANPSHAPLIEALRGLAVKAKLHILTAEARTPADIERAISVLAGQKAEALMILGDSFFVQQAGQIAVQAVRHRLPLTAVTREYVDAGGLMSYGENVTDNFRLAADYVDKIFRGAKPGDLPLGRAQRPYLTINRGTFKALGLAIPHELILRADAVVE